MQDRLTPSTRPAQELKKPRAQARFSAFEKIYTPLKIFAVVQVLAAQGVRPGDMLAHTDLTADALENPGTRTSLAQFLAVCRNAQRLTHHTAWALHVGRRLRPTSYGLYGYALMCSSSLRVAFDQSLRHRLLATPVLPIHWTEESDTATWHLPAFDTLQLPDLDHDLYVCLLEMQAAIHVTLIQDAMGDWCRPLQVLSTAPRPPHADEMSTLFGCPVLFEQARNELQYERKWLDRPPQLAHPITASEMSATCARMIEDIQHGAGLSRKVCEALTRTPGVFPSIEAIAKVLNMNARTLRRNLEEEGTAYSTLLADVRRSLALDYLSQSPLSVSDIAAALGFSEAASFRHAFKRWTGKTPAQFRR
ncbi:AraC family transcriptional regulator [Roseateles koreensis]|uniref:AraC family transcriptional regulator n=1 Tax=Roseateles koreensis TaxID=2987526 RepID=A0ABT5KLK4_9BURK|nr:AraC family transcriptional regulator [Roseateles koreensis]MDC8783795.1 AraC family transcriptional regulator [Roseateles koreensis]